MDPARPCHCSRYWTDGSSRRKRYDTAVIRIEYICIEIYPRLLYYRNQIQNDYAYDGGLSYVDRSVSLTSMTSSCCVPYSSLHHCTSWPWPFNLCFSAQDLPSILYALSPKWFCFNSHSCSQIVAAYGLYEAANHARRPAALLCCVFDLSLSLYGLALVSVACFSQN